MVYCDESRQCAEHFMVLGGIIIPADNLDSFNASMQQFRTEQRMFAELKWSKVSNGKLAEYKAFVDYFFSLNTTRKAHFHALIVDTHKLNHTAFNMGDREMGFYKFFYQLLLHRFGKRYCENNPDARFHLVMDYRTSSYPLQQLRTILNNGLKSRHGIATRPFLTIEPRDSKLSEVLQINDIILGAVGFQKNGLDVLPGSRQAKKDLATYIAKKAHLYDLRDTTPFHQRNFTIWNMQLK